MTAVWRGMSKEMGTRWSGYRPPVSALIETSLEPTRHDMDGQRCDKIEYVGLWDTQGF